MKRRTFFKSSFAAAAVAVIPVRGSRSVIYRSVRQDPPDVPGVTGDGREITIRGTDIADLSARMNGPVLLADDEGYDEARRVLNPSFDRRPALIAQPTGTADVQSAVDFARAYGLLVAVKCGGHSQSGKSTCDGGIQIDLSRFRAVRVDPAARAARVAGGTLLGLVDHEAMAQGLVTPMGTVSHTGVGGLTLGGGFGRLARRFGLSIDNLRSVDIVNADGVLRHASADENRDLFWGVRGGGGNFGVVTHFEFGLHPMQRDVVAGQILFPFSRARDVLALYADYGPEAPDEIQLDYFQTLPPAGGDGVCGFGVCYSGDEDAAERALAPLRALGTPIEDSLRRMDYVAVQRSGDIDDPRARASYLKGGFIPSLPEDLIDAIVGGFEPHPTRATVLFFQQGGGAIGRVAPDATAFAQREAFGNMLSVVDWAFGDDPTEHVRWIKQYWPSLEPFTRGFYTNDQPIDATEEQVNANYRGNFARLVALKNRYDPGNLFRLNTNIQPTV